MSRLSIPTDSSLVDTPFGIFGPDDPAHPAPGLYHIVDPDIGLPFLDLARQYDELEPR